MIHGNQTFLQPIHISLRETQSTSGLLEFRRPLPVPFKNVCLFLSGFILLSYRLFLFFQTFHWMHPPSSSIPFPPISHFFLCSRFVYLCLFTRSLCYMLLATVKEGAVNTGKQTQSAQNKIIFALRHTRVSPACDLLTLLFVAKMSTPPFPIFYATSDLRFLTKKL